MYEPNQGQWVLRATYYKQRGAKAGIRLLSTTSSPILAGWPAHLRGFSSKEAAVQAAGRFQAYLNDPNRKPAPKRPATPLQESPADPACPSAKRPKALRCHRECRDRDLLGRADPASPVYAKRLKREHLLAGRCAQRDRLIRSGLRALRRKRHWARVSKAAQKQRRYAKQAEKRAAVRAEKVCARRAISGDGQARDKIEWYEAQFDRIDKAIRDATTDQLLTISDEHENEPSNKQLQRLMRQAMALRQFYGLCIDKYTSRILEEFDHVHQALLVELARQAGRTCFVCGTTVLNWHRQYIKYDSHFPPDGRGKHERDYLLSNEDLLNKFTAKMKAMAGNETLTLESALEYVNTDLLAGEYCKVVQSFLKKIDALGEHARDNTAVVRVATQVLQPYPELRNRLGEEIIELGQSDQLTTDNLIDFIRHDLLIGEKELLSKYGLKLPIGKETVRSWLHKLPGTSYDEAKKSYYTDKHEEVTNVKYRGQYIGRMERRELRMPVWIQLTDMQHSLMREKQADLPSGFQYNKDNGTAMRELHVDDSDLFEQFSNETDMGGNLSVRFDWAAAQPCVEGCAHGNCQCHLPIWHMGQDESIFKAFQRSKKQWVVDGVRGLRKKSDGPGEMVSAFQCRHRGFGFPLTSAELEKLNVNRVERGLNKLDRSPGVRYLLYGSSEDREGYWDWDKFEAQLEDLVDAFQYFYKDKYQLMIEIDWSSGHSKHREGALNAKAANTKLGGDQPMMRDSKIEQFDGFLGEGSVLKVGDVQSMVFKEGDPPPHFQPEVTDYVGKPKGLKQILWERGLYKDGMVKDIKDGDTKGRDKSFSMVEVRTLPRLACWSVTSTQAHRPLAAPNDTSVTARAVGALELLGLCEREDRISRTNELERNDLGDVP